MPTLLTIGPSIGGAGTAQVDITVTLTLSGSAEAVSYTLKNTFSPVYLQPVNLVSGANTITIPVAPQLPGGVLIIPQAEATYGATLKGISGDTGVTLNINAPTFIAFPVAPQATFVLNWGGKGYNATAVTADSTTEKITKTTHGLANGDRVRFTATALPGGLTAGVWYYVINTATNDFQLSLSLGGSVIDITSNGTSVLLTTADQFRFVWV